MLVWLLHMGILLLHMQWSKKWKAYFKMDKENLEDDDRGGRSTTTTEENIAHVS